MIYKTYQKEIYYLKLQIIVISLFILSFFRESFLIIKNIKRDSKKYNISKSSIIFYSIIVYPLLGFQPSSFFMFHLEKNPSKEYLNYFYLLKIVRKNDIKTHKYLTDKLLFYILLDTIKISTPKVICQYDHKTKKITYWNNPIRTNEVIVKPTKGYGGIDVKKVDKNNVINEIKKCNKNCIVQEKVDQHHLIKEISNSAVNTLRILTYNNGKEIKILKIILKVSRKLTDNVDNIAMGGISVDVNIETGIMGYGNTYYSHGEHKKYIIHPDTKYKFYNKKIPFFCDTKNIALELHRCWFPFAVLIGWDIAITENGPVVIEGNSMPDINPLQIYKPFKKELYKIIYDK